MEYKILINMSIRKKIFLGIIIFTGLCACTERIDLPLDEGSVRLVVEGSITTEPGIHSIYLTESTNYYYNQKPPVVRGAKVEIADGKTVHVLYENFPGVYQTAPDFRGIEGFTYTLQIRLQSPLGGYTEFNASSLLKSPVPLDSAGLEFYKDFAEKGLWEVKCWFLDSVSNDFYRFELARNDTLLTNNLNKWIVTDDKFFNGTYIEGGIITYLNQNDEDERLVPGDILTVTLGNISREHFNFVQDAQAELRGSNPLFSGPGANIRGNISNGAIGFFSAYPVRSVSVRVD